MKKLLLFLSMSVYMFVNAQESSFEMIETTSGDVSFKAINHASIVFKIGGKTVYIDPSGPIERYAGIDEPDIILITDIHQDHYNESTLERIAGANCKFVAPKEVLKRMPETWRKRTEEMANGEKKEFLGISVESIPMYNLPITAESYHIKGRGNGYILEKDGFRIYISGDTDNTPEMRDLKEIDVAFVCMNQPYTMTVENAAKGVIAFKPAVVYPYHYRNGDKSLSDVQKFNDLVSDAGIKCVLLDWYKE